MGYWDATDQYLSSHGGCAPMCLSCGKNMFPQDDHSRFICFCNLGGGLDVVIGMRISTPKIPQVNTSNISDEEKAKIAPINRLESKPTTAEAKVLSMPLSGPKAMDDPEYAKALKDLEEERNK